ncbi:hypothetical protein [Prosthecobacter sp.]
MNRRRMLLSTAAALSPASWKIAAQCLPAAPSKASTPSRRPR